MKKRTALDIVLIEDNPHDLELIMESLRDSDIDDRIAILKNGAEALDYLLDTERSSDPYSFTPPRVIILDLKLPKVSGLEVLRRLKSDNRTRDIPVVIFTSSDEERDKIESYRIGANSYTVKPLDSEEFARVVSEIGHYWLYVNSPQRDNQ